MGLQFDVKARNDYAISLASFYGNLDVVKFLISSGCDIHDNNSLIYASTSGSDYLDLVEISRNPKKFHFFVTFRYC